jgi:segregation and condensation protein A
VALEDRYAGLLPEVMLGVDVRRFAEIAAAVFRPRPPPTVSLAHLHAVQVSVREQAAILRAWLASAGGGTFRELVADCEHTLEVVARFLALLELYREAVLAFDQVDPLGELHVRWVGAASVNHEGGNDGAGTAGDDGRPAVAGNPGEPEQPGEEQRW